MRVIFGSNDVEIKNSAVALGDFDAIHKAHLEIIQSAVDYAKNNGLLSAVYMFSSRPNKNSPAINTLKKRIEILEETGIDLLVVEDFTEEYKNTSCEDFVKDYLKERLDAKAVFVGFNYRFGKDAKGSAKELKNLCKKEEIEVFVKPCVEIDKTPVSSTEIRKLVETGEMETAEKFMTRYFSLSGEVVAGKQIGRTIGFPTANIEYPKGVVIPCDGVYITRSKIGENKYYSITNIGEKPTVFDTNKNIETAIGDFSEDIYGKQIEIEFCKKIREITKFESLDALKARLEADMRASKEFFEKGEKR